MTHNERWSLDLFNDIRHGEGLACSGRAKKRLSIGAGLQSSCQRRNSAGLIAHRYKGALDFKALVISHACIVVCLQISQCVPEK